MRTSDRIKGIKNKQVVLSHISFECEPMVAGSRHFVFSRQKGAV